jgi:hypothetical protein
LSSASSGNGVVPAARPDLRGTLAAYRRLGLHEHPLPELLARSTGADALRRLRTPAALALGAGRAGTSAATIRYRKTFGTVSISEELNMLLVGAIFLLFLA